MDEIVKKVIVSHLPENCYVCPLSESGAWSGIRRCNVLRKSITNPYKRLPSCPLIEEQACKWELGERDGGRGSLWYASYHAGCGEPTYYIYDDDKDEWKFCPNCGKRIIFKDGK